MAKEIIMPKFGFTQEESTIVSWLKQEGDRVERGEPIAEVTTDKVDMEVEAPTDGILRGVRFQEGETVGVTEVIAYVAEEGEELSIPTAKPVDEGPENGSDRAAAGAGPYPSSNRASVTPVARRVAQAEGIDLDRVTGSGPGGKVTRGDVEAYAARQEQADGNVRATPAARRVAREHHVTLMEVAGSGPRGRVQEADVQDYVSTRAAASRAAPARTPEAPATDVQVVPFEGMRKTIAERMHSSYSQAPHITFALDVDMTQAQRLRAYANESAAGEGERVSMTALIVKAVAWALREHPTLNAHVYDDRMEIMPEVNVGVAVALEKGLIVPVVHNADRKGIRQLNADIVGLANRARNGKLRSSDLRGGSFTVSNLGMFGINHFTAILNPPEAAILAVGQTERRLVPDEQDQPVVRPMMTLTLVVDHRAIDGAVAARFLAAIQAALEDPARITL